jgi:hypothetical protein
METWTKPDQVPVRFPEAQARSGAEGFFPMRGLEAPFVARLRHLTASGEYMVPRMARAPLASAR